MTPEELERAKAAFRKCDDAIDAMIAQCPGEQEDLVNHAVGDMLIALDRLKRALVPGRLIGEMLKRVGNAICDAASGSERQS